MNTNISRTPQKYSCQFTTDMLHTDIFMNHVPVLQMTGFY